MSAIPIPTPEQVRSARLAAGMTQALCASRFGYSLRAWQSKEDAGENGRALSPGEYELLLLLAGLHPSLTLSKR